MIWILILFSIIIIGFFLRRTFGAWQSTLRVIVSDYYLDKLENDSLPEKYLFMRFLDKRYPRGITGSREQYERKEIAKRSSATNENFNIVTLIYTCLSIEKDALAERDDAVELIKAELKKELPKFLKRVGITDKGLS